MKLYTEEQIKKLLKENTFLRQDTINIILNNLKPIELPSDEGSGIIALSLVSALMDKLDEQQEAFFIAGFQTYNQWLIEQIKQQSNGK